MCRNVSDTDGLHRRYIPPLFVFALLSLLIINGSASGHHSSYKLHSIMPNSISIEFTAIPSETIEKELFFAFSTLPGISFTVFCSVNYPGISGQVSVPVKRSANGWFGNDYLQWCSYSLETLPDKMSIKGTIKIQFDSPLYSAVKATDISMKKGVLRAPLPRPLQKKSALAFPQVPYTFGIRLEVSSDGIYEIAANSLLKLGVPIDKIESRYFRLYNKNSEIPLFITNSFRKYLQTDDFIRFYGEHLRGTGTYFEQYSNTNVYWLTWSTIPGARIAEVSGGRKRDPSKFNNSTPILAGGFRDTIHIEYDSDIRFLGDVADFPGDDISDPPGIDTIDNWYWNFFGGEELSTYSVIIPSPSKLGDAKLRIAFTGLTSIDAIARDHYTTILLNNNPVGTNNIASWDGQRSYIFESELFSSNQISVGQNVISFLCPARDYPDRIALNWVELEYDRNFASLDNSLIFKNSPDAIGTVKEYQLTDFTSNTLELWDITRFRYFRDLLIVNQTNSGKTLKKYQLIFQDSINGTTTYLASAIENYLKPDMMTLDTIKNDWKMLADADYLIISADTFENDFKPLVECHTRQGLSTVFIAIEDIYNRFSSGIKNPESIRLFLQYLYSMGNRLPRYLLLGGDTTHDLDKNNRSRNIIPTHLSRIPGWGPAADDGYFATVVGEDDFPDLIVGRFPVQNQAELNTLVEKTVKYIEKPERGFWRDNTLLLGGGEAIFSAFNSTSANSIIGPKMNISRLEADSGSIFYKDGITAPKLIADAINAGVFFINFNGHGGGNIWSDNNFFGYKDLSRLYNGQWGNGSRLPVIFSFTCLTGFFESVFYRSLGEEFIRTNNNGAICFYGASAYTSMNGNILMNKLFLENIFSGEFETLGEIIEYGEANMLIRYGPQYLHLVRQYNLLGDPAIPFRLTPDTMKISLVDNTKDSIPSISAEFSTQPVNYGNIMISVKNGYEQWMQNLDTLKHGNHSRKYQLKKDAVISSGLIRAYAWNDSTEIRGWAHFSKDTLLIQDVLLSDANPDFSDSVFIRCILPFDTTAPELYCLYACAPEVTADVRFTGVRMIHTENTTWISANKIPLPFSGRLNDRLQVFFRMYTQSNSRQSIIYSFPIAGLPDLTFTNKHPSIFWDRDSLRATFQILNTGNSPAPPFKTYWFLTENGLPTDTLNIISSQDTLKPGKISTFSFTIADTQGVLPYQGVVNYHNELKELYTDNNTFKAVTRIVKGELKTVKDTLISEFSGLSITPAVTMQTPLKMFILEDTLSPNSTPLQTSSQWSIYNGESPVSFSIGTRPRLNNDDSLCFTIKLLSECTKNRFIMMTYDSSISCWRYCAPVEISRNFGTARYRGYGKFSFACVNDITPPDIMLSVGGRTVHFLDYAAKDKPFSLFITDPSGVNPSSIRLYLNDVPLSSKDYSSILSQSDIKNIITTAYPSTQHRIDSLMVTADDLAGNHISKVFCYKTGDGLSVKFLSCHPNPFSAKTAQNGSRQSIYFAFVLTDLAEKATLTIFTISGKPIRSWSLFNVIGYQEILWNGRDSQDFRIANGTYYAKLEATNDKTKTKKIIRIAKLEGY